MKSKKLFKPKLMILILLVLVFFDLSAQEVKPQLDFKPFKSIQLQDFYAKDNQLDNAVLGGVKHHLCINIINLN